MLLNVSYHKKHAYILFRDVGLNRFRDIKPYLIKTEWGMPGYFGEDFHISVIECVLS